MNKNFIDSILICVVFFLASGTGSVNAQAVDSRTFGSEPAKSQALKGKRLFFEEKARAATEGRPVVSAKANTKAGESVATQSVLVAVSEPPTPPKQTPVSIRYDARIENNATLRVIINGKLCERMDRPTKLSEHTEQKIVCLSLDMPGVRLQLLADGRQIRVMRESVEMGTLSLGQAL